MADFNSSANMNLPIPTVSVVGGPEWASLLNSCLSIIDGHDHSPGSGVQITTDGLNINNMLSMNDNSLVNIESSRYSPQVSPLAGASDLACVYVSGVDLYYNDLNGNQIQITDNGGVAGTPGSIANLVAPASASYSASDESFVWESDADIGADMDMRNAILRNNAANSFGLTLQPPAAMAADYDLILPALPVSTRVLSLSTAGNIVAGASQVIVEADMGNQSVSNRVIVDEAVGVSKLGPLSVSTAKIQANAVTFDKRALRTINSTLGSIMQTSGSGSFSTTNSNTSSPTLITNLSSSLTTQGGVVRASLAPLPGTSPGYIQISSGTGQRNLRARVFLTRDGSTFAVFDVGTVFSDVPSSANAFVQISPGSICGIDTGAAAGAHTFAAYICNLNGDANVTVAVQNCCLVVEEI